MADMTFQMEYWIFTVLGVLVLLVLLLKSIRIIRPHEKGVVERFGKYSRTVSQGPTIIIPFMEMLRKVDMRETLIDVPPQVVITRDNVSLEVDAIIYFEVTDPFRVIYNVSQFEMAALRLAQTNLRNIVGGMSLDETLTGRENINSVLRSILEDATDKWGVRVTRVEIHKIEPPRDITDAMSRQMKAERMKRAAILEAEGVRQANVLKAEGRMKAQMLEAEGESEAIKKVAEAEKQRKVAIAQGDAEATLKTFRAIHEGKASQDVLALKYMESLEKIAEGQATKIFLPVETSGILGAVASLSEAFNDKTGQQLMEPMPKEKIKDKKDSRKEKKG